MGHSGSFEQVGGVRTRPSYPWSRLWFEAVTQASQPVCAIQPAIMGGAAKGTSSWQIARSAARISGPSEANIGSKSNTRPAPVLAWSSAALSHTVLCHSRSPLMTTLTLRGGLGAGAAGTVGAAAAPAEPTVGEGAGEGAGATVGSAAGASGPAAG